MKAEFKGYVFPSEAISDQMGASKTVPESTGLTGTWEDTRQLLSGKVGHVQLKVLPPPFSPPGGRRNRNQLNLLSPSLRALNELVRLLGSIWYRDTPPSGLKRKVFFIYIYVIEIYILTSIFTDFYNTSTFIEISFIKIFPFKYKCGQDYNSSGACHIQQRQSMFSQGSYLRATRVQFCSARVHNNCKPCSWPPHREQMVTFPKCKMLPQAPDMILSLPSRKGNPSTLPSEFTLGRQRGRNQGDCLSGRQ